MLRSKRFLQVVTAFVDIGIRGQGKTAIETAGVEKRVGAGVEREKLTLPRLEAGSMMTGLAHLTENIP